MSLSITTPPSAEPITLADVKLRGRITSDTDDALITSLITPARVFAEKFTNFSLVSKVYLLSLSRFPWPHEAIRLPVPPVSAVASVQYMDPTTYEWVTWDSSEYLIGLNQIPAAIRPAPNNIYPQPLIAPELDTVQIAFTAGPGSGAISLDFSPALEAIRQLTLHFYEHPEAITSDNLKEMPLGIQTLLGACKYRPLH